MSPSALFSLYTMELKTLFSYRVTFWLRLVVNVLVQITAAWFLWGAIFSYTENTTIGGFTLEQMQFYFLLVPLVSGLTMPDDKGIVSIEIYNGSLTKYILYPVSYFMVCYCRYLASFTFGILRFVIGIGLFAALVGFPENFSISWQQGIAFFIIALIASTLHFGLTICVDFAAFWVDVVWNLRVMIRFIISLLGGAMLPLTLFSEQNKELLLWLPFHNLCWLPINLISDPQALSHFWPSLLTLIFWTFFFLALSRFVFNRGKYQYTGVGI